ncbi:MULTISPECIES: hypothetical protein [Streptomyces]|uniref:hypothetical protein n=1 Tax=Streptomyces TaxID=1883 RepID=UPI0034249B53
MRAADAEKVVLESALNAEERAELARLRKATASGRSKEEILRRTEARVLPSRRIALGR